MSPSDSRVRRTGVMHSAEPLTATPPWPPRTWVSQVPGCSVSARCPLTPRGARSLHTLVASRPVLASPSLAGWPLPLRNGAETGSLTLRLTDSRPEASTKTIAPPAARFATGKRAIPRTRTFHLARSSRLLLTHQRADRGNGRSVAKYVDEFWEQGSKSSMANWVNSN